jgi:hypothetical protein
MMDAVQEIGHTRSLDAILNELYAESLVRQFQFAQQRGKRAWVILRFPHFHSNGYYYCLSTSSKTG